LKAPDAHGIKAEDLKNATLSTIGKLTQIPNKIKEKKKIPME
jgi:hypothetical protein